MVTGKMLSETSFYGEEQSAFRALLFSGKPFHPFHPALLNYVVSLIFCLAMLPLQMPVVKYQTILHEEKTN